MTQVDGESDIPFLTEKDFFMHTDFSLTAFSMNYKSRDGCLLFEATGGGYVFNQRNGQSPDRPIEDDLRS